MMDKRYKRADGGPSGTRSRTGGQTSRKPIAWNRDTEAVGDGLFDAEVKLPLTTAAKLAFASQKTRPPSRATLFRWIRKGKCGVRLESRRFNGNYQTSVEAIMRFIQAVDRATVNPLSQESRRSNELKRVSRVLDDLGI